MKQRVPLEVCEDWAKNHSDQLLLDVAADPCLFLSYVETLDEHDLDHPIKRFPPRNATDVMADWERPLTYLWELAELWHTKPLIAVLKSRQMLMTWLFLSLYLWDPAYHVGRRIFLQSKKEEDAKELLNRQKGMLKRLPACIRPRYRATTTRIQFYEHDSEIRAMPQGADQVRSYTFSGGYVDEAAFQELFEASYGACLPTIEGGGKLTVVSTAAPSFFIDLHGDKIERA